ncbi:unnamed protein product [Taenia asiatica]|uniref:Bravo_FIGEY domain-containing protein n=1 Tax=Taenia asiatica TaxID=60517 RepID=A0A0R3VXT1_TAEAS|nr:unnamed protein product [Taenia asiatica]
MLSALVKASIAYIRLKIKQPPFIKSARMKSLHFICCIILFVVDATFWAEARPDEHREEANDDLRNLQGSRSEMSLEGERGPFSSGNISLEMAREEDAGRNMVCLIKNGDVEDNVDEDDGYDKEDENPEEDKDEDEEEEEEEREDLGMPTLGYGSPWTGVFDGDNFDRNGDHENQGDDGSAFDGHTDVSSDSLSQECIRGDDGACKRYDISSMKFGPRAIDVSSYRRPFRQV